MERRGHGVGGLGRLPPAKRLGARAGREVGVFVGAQYGDRAVLSEVRTASLEWLIARLDVDIVFDQAGEHVVDPLEHRSRGPEVRRESGRGGADLVGRAHVLGDVGAPESIDRLLGIANDEQPARQWIEAGPVAACRVLVFVAGVRCKSHRDLELDRIGVLELVEQDPTIATM